MDRFGLLDRLHEALLKQKSLTFTILASLIPLNPLCLRQSLYEVLAGVDHRLLGMCLRLYEVLACVDLRLLGMCLRLYEVLAYFDHRLLGSTVMSLDDFEAVGECVVRVDD